MYKELKENMRMMSPQIGNNKKIENVCARHVSVYTHIKKFCSLKVQ